MTKQTETLYKVYWKKRYDGTISLVDELAGHTSAYLSRGKIYETLEERSFPVVEIGFYRQMLEDATALHVFDRHQLHAALKVRPPQSEFEALEASRLEAIYVASPIRGFREAYFEALETFPDSGDLGAEVFAYNLSWVVGLIRNYCESLSRRAKRIRDAINGQYRWGWRLAALIGGSVLASLYHLPFAAFGPLVTAVAGFGLILADHKTMASVERDCKDYSGGFTGAARDAAQKRRNAIGEVLADAERLEMALMQEVRNANDKAWHRGDVRTGPEAREFLARAAERVGLFCRTLVAQTRTVNRAAEMAYAGPSIQAEFDASYTFTMFGFQAQDGYDFLKRCGFAAVMAGVVAAQVMQVSSGASLLSVTGAGVAVTALTAFMRLCFVWRRTVKLQAKSREPDEVSLFIDLIHRATPPNLGKAEQRYEQERTEMVVNEAIRQARDQAWGR